MRLKLLFAVLAIFAQAQPKAQSDSAKKIKPYLVKVETIVGKNERGLLYKVNSDTLELLPYSNKYRPFIGRQIKLAAGQIQSFTIQRKGSKSLAIGLGTLLGGITGGIVGAVAAPNSNCPPDSPLCNLERAGYGATGMLIGMGAGALTGFLIAKGKQKKFMIGGNKHKFLDLHAELMKKAYFNQ